jgi:hypothetical protein
VLELEYSKTEHSLPWLEVTGEALDAGQKVFFVHFSILLMVVFEMFRTGCGL